MAKRKAQQNTQPAAKASKSPTGSKAGSNGSSSKLVTALLDHMLLSQSYCEELGIDIFSGDGKRSGEVFKWLACACLFGSRLSEQVTLRAAKGFLTSGLDTPQRLLETPLKDEIVAAHSQGNVQRAPSMSHYLTETSRLVMDKYDGDLDKLREAAGKDPDKERELIREFKGFGPMAVDIFCREAQAAWPEMFPFCDKRTLGVAEEHGLPGNTEELAALVGNDSKKFVKLLSALTKAQLRKVPIDDETGEIDGAPLEARREKEESMPKNVNKEKVEEQIKEGVPRYPK